MRPLIPYLTAAALFGIGVFGVLRRRNAILLLMAVELMLGAVNLILVTASTTVRAQLAAAGAAGYTGQVFALFVIVIAAAEVGLGLAIVLQLYRLRASVAVDTVPLTDPPAADPADDDGDAPGVDADGATGGSGGAGPAGRTPGDASGDGPPGAAHGRTPDAAGPAPEQATGASR